MLRTTFILTSSLLLIPRLAARQGAKARTRSPSQEHRGRCRESARESPRSNHPALHARSGMSPGSAALGLCDRPGSRRIYLGRTGDGLGRFDGYKFAYFSTTPRRRNSISTTRHRAPRTTARAGVVRHQRRRPQPLDYASEVFITIATTRRIEDPLQRRGHGAHKDAKGSLWVGTTGGLDRLSRAARISSRATRRRRTQATLTPTPSWRSPRASPACGSAQRRPLPATLEETNSFVQYKHDDDEAEEPRRRHRRGGVRGQAGHCLGGPDGAGLDTARCAHRIIRAPSKRGPTDPQSLSDDRVRAISKTRTARSGWARRGKSEPARSQCSENSSATSPIATILHAPPYPIVSSLFEDKGTSCGSAPGAGGIGKLDLAGGRLPLYKSESPFAFYDDGKGVLWMGEDHRSRQARSKKRHAALDQGEASEAIAIHAIHPTKKARCGWGPSEKRLRSSSPTASASPFTSRSQRIGPHQQRHRLLHRAGQERFVVGRHLGRRAQQARRRGQLVHLLYRGPERPRGAELQPIFILSSKTKGAERPLARHRQRSGANRFDTESRVFTPLDARAEQRGEPQQHNNVLCVHEDKDGILWLGTYGGGLNRFDRKTSKFKAYTTKTPPAQLRLRDPRRRRGNLWLPPTRAWRSSTPKTEIILRTSTSTTCLQGRSSTRRVSQGPERRALLRRVHGFNVFQPRDMKLESLRAAGGDHQPPHQHTPTPISAGRSRESPTST